MMVQRVREPEQGPQESEQSTQWLRGAGQFIGIKRHRHILIGTVSCRKRLAPEHDPRRLHHLQAFGLEVVESVAIEL